MNGIVGLSAIPLGLVCLFISRVIDGGFVGGLFLGAAIALMVIGTYLLGARMWYPRRDDHELSEGSHWLPSRDETGGPERG